MTLSPARVPDAGAGSGSAVRQLTATLYGYAFLDDFVLLYPVYALLFADSGLTVWQISSLFALWSITGVFLEVPSGAWADSVSRRTLLWLAPLLTATGFALWVTVPSYGAFALGFVLWGAGGALSSGAREALVYDELDRLGAADRYARVMGRARAVGLLAVMAAMALAGPVFALGGYPAVGTASVLACLLGAATATRFQEHRVPKAADDDGESKSDGKSSGCGGSGGGGGGWTVSLRGGLAECRENRSVRRALLLVPAVAAVWGALDEYTPLLIRDTGVADRTVPYLLLLVWAIVTAGSLLAGAAERLGTTGLAVLLAGGGLALAVGAATRTPAGLVLVGVAFGCFQLAEVLADVRLQHRIDETRRATLTSFASLGTEVVTVAVFGVYALIGTTAAHSTVFAVLAVPYLVTGLVLAARKRGAEARP
ncbi:MFS transporter [Streptomyces sp. NPDC048484]|uniref:MFS transporter n=1 Tax=Streptomyces sp. NPDC048484 TaxID=3155146 RepID=UPI00341CE60B